MVDLHEKSPPRTGEIVRKSENKTSDASDNAVLGIPKDTANGSPPSAAGFTTPVVGSAASPETSANKLSFPTKPTVLKRSVYSKPKSRFGEKPVCIDSKTFEEMLDPTSREQIASPAPPADQSEEEDEEAEIFMKVELSREKRQRYVLHTLSGQPLVEKAERAGKLVSSGYLSLKTKKKKKNKGGEKEVIDMGKLHRMKRENVSAWTMKVLVDAVMNSELSTISNALEEEYIGIGEEQRESEITNEMEAIAAADKIFKNVAHHANNYIEEDDILRFMIKEEVDLVFSLFEGAEKRRINKKSLAKWVVKVYKGRKMLAHSLKDTNTAVKQLNKIVTGIAITATVIIWLLLMEVATTEALILLSSPLVVAASVFGNTFQTIFEALIFVFVVHPFDVGDRCVVDGVQMMVEEMNILTTVFLNLNKEKFSYPNSVLGTKPISNHYRSPDMTLPLEKIGALKENEEVFGGKFSGGGIETNHSVVVKEIEQVKLDKYCALCQSSLPSLVKQLRKGM